MIYYITIINSNNLSAKIIQFGGWLESIFKGEKTKKIYNHCEIRSSDWTFGAISSGAKKRNWLSYWTKLQLKGASKIDYIIILNTEEKSRAEVFIKDNINIKYEYSMFLFHALKIFTNKWYGAKNNNKYFCYELMIKFLNQVKQTQLDPYMSPLEFKLWADSNLTRI